MFRVLTGEFDVHIKTSSNPARTFATTTAAAALAAAAAPCRPVPAFAAAAAAAYCHFGTTRLGASLAVVRAAAPL